ncbi:hypothetical protein [Arachidicoccus ginsenosidimutans]|uniref:hypothetical protein n=1 Tax=Arachidicoccus sp. BS20 TaxID=1850526 RepID=UPI0012E8AE84|nr:hypothetical protein [Arachidicoccus sp. BS20]
MSNSGENIIVFAVKDLTFYNYFRCLVKEYHTQNADFRGILQSSSDFGEKSKIRL